jgi:hypothetical protein
VLDGLSPEQVLQSNSESEFLELVTLLRPTQAALLKWAVELMSDVVEEEELNKMNARNIAMVFAPNMTQVISIPLFVQYRVICMYFPHKDNGSNCQMLLFQIKVYPSAPC